MKRAGTPQLNPLAIAGGVIRKRVRATDAFKNGRAEVVSRATLAIGANPTVERLRTLGGITKVVERAIAEATTDGLDVNHGSVMIPTSARDELGRDLVTLRSDVQDAVRKLGGAS